MAMQYEVNLEYSGKLNQLLVILDSILMGPFQLELFYDPMRI